MKQFDANGTDIDAYPDRAFKGGVYERGTSWKPEPICKHCKSARFQHNPNSGECDSEGKTYYEEMK